MRRTATKRKKVETHFILRIKGGIKEEKEQFIKSACLAYQELQFPNI
jgi:hypothetical protein